MSDWQPIDTAPKDGTEVLLWWFRRHVVGSYVAGGWTDESLGQYDVSPTHWMPLPEPPE